MRYYTPMMVIGLALASLMGCSSPPAEKAVKTPVVTAKPAPLQPLPPLPVLAEELESPPESFLVKKPVEPKPVAEPLPMPPTPPEENTLRIRLAEQAAHKDRAQFEIRYTQRVLRHVQQHENDFIANWNPSDVEWAGPIEPILQGYRQIKTKCEQRLCEQQEELRRAEADWAQADADLKKHLNAAK